MDRRITAMDPGHPDGDRTARMIMATNPRGAGVSFFQEMIERATEDMQRAAFVDPRFLGDAITSAGREEQDDG